MLHDRVPPLSDVDGVRLVKLRPHIAVARGDISQRAEHVHSRYDFSAGGYCIGMSRYLAAHLTEKLDLKL